MVKKTNPDDIRLMHEALKQAQNALDEGEVPIGAVLAVEGKIVAKGYNQVELLNDATAHAEILALTSASELFDSKYLPECTLYVTLEPCAMCASAAGWAHIGRIVFGAPDTEKGFGKTAPNVLHKKCKVEGGVLTDECKYLLQTFFNRKRLT